MCGYAVDFLRSCYASTWDFPEAPAVAGEFFFCPPGTPHYGDWHYFGSRNWHKGDATPWPDFGETEDAKQAYRNGSFPVQHPDPILIGDQQCLEVGFSEHEAPASYLFGVPTRCWRDLPHSGGLAGGGVGIFGLTWKGGLAGGGGGRGQVTGGGLAGGGGLPRVLHGGGLAGGGLGKGQLAGGGLAGGGLGKGQLAGGGLAGGGLGKGQLAGGGLYGAARQPGGLAGGGLGRAHIGAGGLAGGGAGSAAVPKPISIVQHKSGGTSGTGTASLSLTWTVQTTAGNQLVAIVHTRAGSGSVKPTISAPAGWTLAIDSPNDIQRCACYYLENAAAEASTGNFIGTLSGVLVNLVVAVVEVAGLKLSGTLDKALATNGVGTAPSTAATGTLAQAKELIVAGFSSNGLGTFSAPTNGFTIGDQANVTGDGTGGLSWKIVASTATQSTAMAAMGAIWAATIVSFLGS